MIRWLLLVASLSCASRPTVIQLAPDDEPLCGFIKVDKNTATHCCVQESGPALIVQCLELEHKQPQTRQENPARES